MQGLQPGNASPKKLSNGMRWSLDDGKVASDNSTQLAERIRTLEQRNTALAKMLEYATEELWIQQKNFAKEAETTADALSLAIAKVQFVQVYLENSNMPFPSENPVQEATEVTDFIEDPANKPSTSTEINTKPKSTLEQNSDGIQTTSKPEPEPPAQLISDSSSPAQPVMDTATLEKPAMPNRPGPSPFHHPRPSLAQSSFSWMLGEDQRKSSFISASPFPSEKRSARGKAGFLFGDDKAEGGKHSVIPKGKETEDENNEESITLGTLKAGIDAT